MTTRRIVSPIHVALALVILTLCAGRCAAQAAAPKSPTTAPSAPPAEVKEIYWWVNHSIWGCVDRGELIKTLHESQGPTLKIHPVVVFGGHFEWDRPFGGHPLSAVSQQPEGSAMHDSSQAAASEPFAGGLKLAAEGSPGTVFESAKATWDLAEKLGMQPVACFTLWPQFEKDYPPEGFAKAVLTQQYWDTLSLWSRELAERLGIGVDRIVMDAEPYNAGSKIVRAWFQTPGFKSSWDAFLLQEICRETAQRHGKWCRFYLPGRSVWQKPYGFYNSIGQLCEVNINEPDYRPTSTPISTDDEIPGAWLASADDPFYRDPNGVAHPLFTAESFLRDRLPLYRRHFVYVDYSLVDVVAKEFKAARSVGGPQEIDVKAVREAIARAEKAVDEAKAALADANAKLDEMRQATGAAVSRP